MVDYCLPSIYGCCFTSRGEFRAKAPAKKVENFLRSQSGQDKLLKFAAEGVFPIISEIAHQAGASDRTMSNIEKGQSGAKTVRDFTAFFNLFRGIIAGAIETALRIVKLVRNLFSDVPVCLEEPKKVRVDNPEHVRAIWAGANQPVDLASLPLFYTLEVTPKHKHNEVAKTTGEKLLQLGKHVASLIANCAYIAGFGFFKPCAIVRKHFDVKYGKTGNRIADLFPKVMVGNHAGGVLQNAFELAYLGVSYNRAMHEVGLYDPQQVQKDHDSKVMTAVLGLFEKMFELLKDLFMLLKATLPVPATLALGFIISGLGLVQAWRKTTA